MSEREAYQQRLMEKLDNVSDMEEILEIILNNQYGHMGFDSIIYSDVYEKKNKVVVYTAGEPLKAMRQGETFSYEGTIAENIERYGLDHLIMEDTFSSIKAIDWALFIPHGLQILLCQVLLRAETNAHRTGDLLRQAESILGEIYQRLRPPLQTLPERSEKLASTAVAV
jgi:hypothetical protein